MEWTHVALRAAARGSDYRMDHPLASVSGVYQTGRVWPRLVVTGEDKGTLALPILACHTMQSYEKY